MRSLTCPSPGRRRRLAGGGVAFGCAVLAGLCSLMWCDVVLGNVVPVLQALTPLWVVAAVPALLVAGFVRTRAALVAGAVLAVAALVSGVTLAQRPDVPTSVRDAAGAHTLRVFSLNAELGGADATSIERAVDRVHPDIIVLPEMTATKLAELDAEGFAETFPHRAGGMIDDGSRGTAILSRYAVTTLDADTRLGPFDLQTPTALVHAPGADITVRGVHSYPPLADGADQWRPQLRAEGAWQRSVDSAHLVMAGDFNASYANPAFRELSRGLVDALPASSSRWIPTWPHGNRMPPFAQIDHILTRGFVPEQAGTMTVEGTDHSAVWSVLRY